MVGFVSIVGAGPWDPELLTLAGRERLSRADVVIADYLVNPALLMHCPPHAEVIQRVRGPRQGPSIEPRLNQDRVNELLVEHARAGRFVVRLKGGDPMVFGRGAEEAEVLREAGIDFELVPGVSAALAAPEAAGIPVTHRGHTPAVCLVSGFEAYEKSGLSVAWEHLANSAGTLVLMMSVKNCRQNADRLVAAGRAPDTPVAVVRWGTRGIQRTVVGTLATIADDIAREGIRAPAVMVVGDVVRRREKVAWFERRPLYGRRVVVTRARRQAGELLHALAAQGADAVAFPCLDVAPPTDTTPLDQAVATLSPDATARPYGLIISSPNGAAALQAALDRTGLDARALAGVAVAAIGTGTARSLEQQGLRPDLVPDRARSEGLIDLLREREVLDRRWLHLRADEGRGLLAHAIEAAGGTLETVVAYRVVRPSVPGLLLRSLLDPGRGGEGVDAITFASGRTARHFMETLTEAHGEATARNVLERARVIALGPVTRDAIEALGVRVDQVARNPGTSAMVQAVVEALDQAPDQASDQAPDQAPDHE